MIIQIHGRCGAGKTTLALALERFLQSQGFTQVSVIDPDVTYQTHYPQLQEKRMLAIRTSRVIIETHQDISDRV